MPDPTRSLTIKLVGDVEDLQRDLTRAQRKLAEFDRAATQGRGLETFSQRADRVGASLTRTLTPAAQAMGAAFQEAFAEVDGGLDAIRATTGATGQALTDLENVAKSVSGTVTAGFAQVGQAVGDLAAATDLTGESLETVTRQVLQLEQVGNAVSTDAVAQALQDWGVAAEDSAESLDLLFRASQETGTPMERLLTLVKQYGAPLREFGFEMDEAAVLLGGFEEAGVNTELAMGGLRRALGQFASAGRDPQQALQETFEAIEAAGSAAEATGLAFDAFGARAGADLAQAIRQGRFSFEEMLATVEGGTDTIAGVAADTADWGDKLAMLGRQAQEVIGPVGEIGFALSGALQVAGPAISGFGKLSDAFKDSAVKGGALSRVLGSKLTGAIGGVTAVLAVAVAAWNDYNQRQASGRAAVDNLSEALVDQTAAVDEDARAFVEAEVASRNLGAFLSQAGVSVDDLTAALLGDADAMAEVERKVSDAEGPVTRLTEGLAGMGLRGDSASQQIYDLANQWDAAGDNAEYLEGQTAGVGRALGDTAPKVEELSEAEEHLALITSGATVAFVDYEAQLYRNRTAVEGYGEVIYPVISLTDEWAAALGEFVSPAGAYDAAVQAIATTTAEQTDDATDSWEDYAADVDVNVADVIGQLQAMVTAQEEWATNFAIVGARVPAEFLPQLERLATESPELLAEMVTATDAELEEFVGLATRAAPEFTAAIQNELERAIPVLTQVADTMGQSTADALIRQLAAGTIDAAGVANAYTNALAGNVTPLLIALGEDGIPYIAANLDFLLRNSGGVIPGGGPDRDSVHAYLTPGEWVINRGVSDRIGDWRMGLLNDGKATVVPYNGGGAVRSDEDAYMAGTLTGGYQTPDQVPRPPGFGPASAWAYDPARATTRAAYDAVVAFVAMYGGGARPELGSQAFARGGGGGAAGAYTAGMRQAFEVAQSMGFTSIGGYRSQGSVSTSDHPRHRAWDFMLPGGQSNKPPGWRLATWHVGHSTDVGTKYLIFDDLINSGSGWRPYHHPNNPGDKNPTLAHRDHLHASYFADGGIVTRPTFAILGENGPEAVIPLNAGGGVPGPWGGSGPYRGPRGPGTGPYVSPEELQAIADAAEAARLELIAAIEAARGFAETTDKMVDDALADLNRMVADERRIRAQMAEVTRRHNEALEALERRYSEQIQAELDRRGAAIRGFASISQRFVAGWGNTAGALTRNIIAQAESITRWAAAMDTLRARGLDEGLISALGLDDPANFAQAEQLLRATDTELAALNEAWLSREGAVGDRVADEQARMVGGLGATLTDLHGSYIEALDQLNTDFAEAMSKLNDELQAIGMDLGLTFDEAIAAGIASGLPGIKAQVDEVLALLSLAESAEDAVAALLPPPPRPHSGPGSTGGWGGSGGRAFQPTVRSAATSSTSVRVYIGNQELTDIVRVETDKTLDDNRRSSAMTGRR